MNKQSNVVFTTDEYDIFQIPSWNRSVDSNRKKRVKKSIDNVGYIQAPVLVNEKMEVIDGQARLTVCKEENIPISYIVISGIGKKECTSMNSTTTNWKLDDYLESYVSEEKESYIALKKLSEKFNKIPLSKLILICQKRSVNSGTKDFRFETGSFEFTEDIIELSNKLTFITRMLDYTQKKFNNLFCIGVLCAVYDMKNVDKELLIKQMEKYSNKLEIANNFSSAFNSLSNIYNFHRKSGSGLIVDFFTEYRNEKPNITKSCVAKYGWTF